MLIRLFLFQFLFLCVVNIEWWNNEVFELTNENVMKVIGNNKIVVIDFFTPWCYYCQKLSKDYLKLYEHFKDSNNVMITKVNCEENEQICDLYKVPVYPTIIIVSPNNINKFKKFNGNYDFMTINTWIHNYISQQQQSQPDQQKQIEQNQQIVHFDYGSNSKQIFEFIFSIFEQMSKQNRVFNKKVKVIDKEMGMVKYTDQQIFERIKFDSQSNFNGLLAMLILLIGAIVSIICYYSFTRMFRTDKQMIQETYDSKELEYLKDSELVSE